ncbi:proton-coupled amino acid transporter-like protein pathetic [Drosophila madeirensis]|uniref:Blast:Proton-coupled amino acid transporter 4 n=2 Tax=obscura subgroup TaxID=32357 RepID=A0A3B0JT44_DROGU|nr:proton-coupled amino acid transporter-like protein pathetic isoform X2 [Drosophila guanche]XP_034120969.1 proton-coupled amino acid transporter-like protein pathetic isoform X2 [Drosophila guanche]XP_034659375.1 proton-coupled amino acid transporter-like protein pathetic isoform X1 [Drosophila subobscura]XP_034659376.1 proton-coupled amino acid transporter-like protein pathetic isoform X1 [Drosophila subobscura]XP_034659377.1 proton-coupled amino acid transporter-like protein pathetic isofor
MVNIVDGGAKPAAQEMEQFLPGEGGIKYHIQPRKSDNEQGLGNTEFNPFTHRDNEHPTSDNETLTHLLKASLGTGILGMPIAFMYSGIIMGIFATIFTAFVCTHCSYVLVKCGHKLYYKTRRTKMTFAEIAESAFQKGPKWCRGFAPVAKFSILFGLFLTYFGTCSVYTVIVAKNFEQLIEHWTGSAVSSRLLICALLVPLILIAWVPNLKYLAPVSMVANVFMGLGLGITFYYLTQDLPPVESRNYLVLGTLPSFFSITIFAMEAIGVVMPLENNMKTPQNFLGLCGVLSQGMSGVTLIYMLLGFLGYLRYGEDTQQSITLNLPVHEWPAQAVKVLIALAVYCTFGLQFYVCLEIVWDGIKEKCTKRPMLVNYVLRTVLVTAAVVLAISVPTIAPFMGLIGAFCFSILGLIFPVLIELVIHWDTGFGKYNWILWKNIVICICGVAALVFGSLAAIRDIIAVYSEVAPQ